MYLREEFRRAAEGIAENLGYSGKIVYHFKESLKIGLGYNARLSIGSEGFDFWIRTETNEEDPTSGDMEATISIYFDPVISPFYLHEDITYLKGHSSFLSRWGFWAIYNFRLKHNGINLENVFHDSTIRTYTLPGHDIDEIEIIMNHVLKVQENPLICYQFGHVDGEYKLRCFSYAFWVELEHNPGFWAFFPDYCGLDSGGSRIHYDFIEGYLKKIGEKVGIDRRRFDLDYQVLKMFLLKNTNHFYDAHSKEYCNIIRYWMRPYGVLGGNERKLEEFIQRYESENYPQALRDLRALLQDTQEYVLREKSIEPSEKADVNSLAHDLIQNHIIDGRLLSWFHAFASYANLASHGDFPNEQDLKNYTTEQRVHMTVKLGLHLMKELDDILHDKINFEKGDELLE